MYRPFQIHRLNYRHFWNVNRTVKREIMDNVLSWTVNRKSNATNTRTHYSARSCAGCFQSTLPRSIFLKYILVFFLTARYQSNLPTKFHNYLLHCLFPDNRNLSDFINLTTLGELYKYSLFILWSVLNCPLFSFQVQIISSARRFQTLFVYVRFSKYETGLQTPNKIIVSRFRLDRFTRYYQLWSRFGARGSVVGWGNILQTGRSWDRLQMRSLDFISLTNPSCRTMALGLSQPLNRNDYQESPWG
jgi:hypothetical protein